MSALSDVFHALAAPARRAILDDVLEAAGLVSSRREGRYKFHYLDTAPLKGIAQRWSIED